MRIENIRVDGYGLLNDFDVANIAPGLSVFYGPNEAGKSTLLDFVRRRCSAFPIDDKNRDFTRHCVGVATVVRLASPSDAGERWTIERHTDAHHLELIGSDGALCDPSELARLLGRTDDKLFNSIFAFGLGELATFASLDSDEVRDRVFSAGVLGAGRSANRAIRARPTPPGAWSVRAAATQRRTRSGHR